MLQVVAEIAIEARRPRVPRDAARSTRSTARRRCSPSCRQFQPADTPERLDALARRGSAAYGAFMDAHIDIMADGLRSGRTAARIVADRTIDQLERILAIPIEEAIVPAMSKVGRATRTASGSGTSCARSSTRRTGGSSRRSGARTTRRRASSRASCRRPTARRSTGTRSGAGRRSTWSPRDVHQVGLDELASIDDERRAIARAPRASATTSTAYRRQLATDPANQAPTPEELVARATRTSCRAAEVAPRVFGRAPEGELRGPAGRGVQGEGRAVRVLLPADDRRLAARHLLRQHLRPAEPHVLQARRRRRSTRRSRATTSRSASRWSTPASTCSGGSAPGPPRGAYIEGWGLYAERLADELGLYRDDAERFGMLDAQAWRASRLIVDSGMHGAGLVAPAVDRLAARHRPVRDRRRRSRPTATSRGRARRSPT